VNAGLVWQSVRGARRGPILAGVVLCWFTVLIAGLRWHRLLEAFGIHIPRRALVCIAQIGQFFLMFLPGPAGDDLTRMLYISRLSGEGQVGAACTTVLLDRCIGLASILLMAVACIPWQWGLLAASRKTWWMAVGMSAAGGVILVCTILYFVIDGRVMQRMVEKLLGLLPASKIRDEFRNISAHIFTSKTAIATVIGAAVGTQFLLCLVFYLAGRSVGIDAPFAEWLGFVPIVLAANAVPITVAGIGVDGGQALAASLMTFAMMLAVCLLGGVVYVFYRPKKKAV
jgi:uncharacterized protein (TIRG00374 family)